MSAARNEIQAAARLLAAATRVVVTTGAGMSKESGIPTFRDAPSALWADYDPMELATPEGFMRNPPLVWEWYAQRRQMIAQCKPHDGHRAIATMETLGYSEFLLVTQNIDNLHREAGSSELIEIHGNIFRFKCFENHHPITNLPEGDEVPPRCQCGSVIRPDVVWFGEMLDDNDMRRVYEAVAMCDVMLVVGTSGIVYPAAGLPATARSAGASVIEINPERTAVSDATNVFIQSAAGDALSSLLEGIEKLRAGGGNGDKR